MRIGIQISDSNKDLLSFSAPRKKALHSLRNQISRLIRIGSRYLPFVSTASENALSPRFFPVFQTPTSIFLSTFLPLGGNYRRDTTVSFILWGIQ